MSNPSNYQFHKFSQFDSTAIQAVYPGVTTVQLEPGSLEGWIRAATIDQVRINTGTLNRAALYEGSYNDDMINVGFILNPDSTAVVHGHGYGAGTVSVDVGDVYLHEAYPANMIWAGISIPEEVLLEDLKAHHATLRSYRHLALKGPREDLELLVKLTHNCVDPKSGTRKADAKRLSARVLSAIRELLSSRLESATHDLPYAEGDKFLMHLVKASQKLSEESGHQPLSLSEICKATGMKSRTLQKYFKELYGMGPTEYFRTRRLNAVRSALMKADSKTTRVNETAEQWGFDHLGRFSVRYRHMFGESPSKTLNRTNYRD